MQELSEKSNHECLDSGYKGGSDSAAADWFKGHIESVGSPRPERQKTTADEVAERATRDDAIRQVQFMAERYKAQTEQRKKEFSGKRAASAPDLSKVADDALRQSSSRLPDWQPCMHCCAVLKVVEDAWSNRSSQMLRRRRPSGITWDSPENSVIIFDWDDTLLPTTFIVQQILPNLPEAEWDVKLKRGKPYYEELAAHAHIVGFVLRAARRAGRVAIVTNSMSPWVVASAERYLPGLDIQSILLELDIPVYYARRHVAAIEKSMTFSEEWMDVTIDHTSNGRIGMDIVPSATSLRVSAVDDFGLVGEWNSENPFSKVMPGDWIVEVNGETENLAKECRKPQVLRMKLLRQVPLKEPYTEAKRIDMEKVVNRFYGLDTLLRKNVLSIGDSVAEQMAVKEALPRGDNPRNDALCKTVALLARPTIHQLSNELKILLVWLVHMVQYEKDFDLAMNRLDTLEKEFFKQ